MGLVVFVTIFLAIDYMSTSMRFHAPTEIMLRYYRYYLPLIVYQLIPVGGMVGTMFTLSMLNRNNELVALFSMGLSLARVSLPILVSLGLVCVFTFWMGDHVTPAMARKMNYVYYVEMRNRPSLYSTVRENKIWYRSENTIFNIQALNAAQGTAQGITLYYFDEAWTLVQLIKAKSVKMQDRAWGLEDGTVTLFAEESSFPLTKPFAKKTLMMSDELSDIRSAAPSSETLSVSELRRYVQKNKEAGLDTLSYEVDLYAKMSFAFAALVLSLMGIPFTVQQSRAGGNMLSIGLSIGIAFVYWVMYSASLTLGKHGSVPPMIAAWGPNLICGLFATVMLMRLKR